MDRPHTDEELFLLACKIECFSVPVNQRVNLTNFVQIYRRLMPSTRALDL